MAIDIVYFFQNTQVYKSCHALLPQYQPHLYVCVLCCKQKSNRSNSRWDIENILWLHLQTTFINWFLFLYFILNNIHLSANCSYQFPPWLFSIHVISPKKKILTRSFFIIIFIYYWELLYRPSFCENRPWYKKCFA